MAQDIEFRFKVGVAVGVVGNETLAGQMEAGGERRYNPDSNLAIP